MLNRFLLTVCLTVLLSGHLHADVLIGAKAPDVGGKDLQGKTHRLSDYRGKIVVLEWSSPECPYSRRYYENGTLDSLYDYAAKNGVVWINIVPKLQIMTREQALKHLDESKKTIIMDSDLAISTAYGATTTPQILIIDEQGILSYTGAIDSTAMMTKTANNIVSYTHDALDDLLAGRKVSRAITRAFGCFIKSNVPSDDGLPAISGQGSR
ncbi:MAG: redoxin domain-containing protein [Gammaproteobacteria bacterium]